MDKSELLQLQTNASPQDNSTSSKEDRTIRLELPDTPYFLVGNKKEGYCITLGKYKISDDFGYNAIDEEDLIHGAMTYIEQHQYNIIFHTICAIQNIHTELTKDTIKTN